jgi:methylmalonyl-CoA/ethylmalonyl-CoA epimerase
MISGLHQHHIGCLVHNIESFKEENDPTWGKASYSQIHTVSTQDVKVCFLQFSSDTIIELVEPGPENQALSRMIQKGITFYHVGFITDAYEKSVKKLVNGGFRLVNEFNSEAFGGKRCAFLFHPQLQLIELIEGRVKTS